MKDLVIPSVGGAISISMAKEIESHVALVIHEKDDVQELNDWRDKFAALEVYLRGKGLSGPMLASQRMVEARIGQLLGDALVGSHHSVTTEGGKVPKDDRSDFRILSKGFDYLKDEDWQKSRRALVAKIRKDLDIPPETPSLPAGQFDVIVVDPPWDVQKIERYERENQEGFDYSTLSDEAIAGITLPDSDNCHIWLWTTHKKLPVAFQILEAWRARYVCTFVWHKPGGFQPVGLPQYNCEFSLYARKGKPNELDTVAFPVCFTAPRGAHSEKPDEFYAMLRRTTSGRRMDMFSRRYIEGFEGWGNESGI